LLLIGFSDDCRLFVLGFVVVPVFNFVVVIVIRIPRWVHVGHGRTPEERESRMRDLAQKLIFTVETANGRYTLIRTADVSRPVNEKDLTLKEAEELLGTWKLRGQGG
jgi:hypothetical protein